MRSYSRIATFLTLILIAAGQYAPHAQAASPWKSAPTYSDKMLRKLDFGVTNFLVGWTAVISQTAGDYKPKNSPTSRFLAFFPSLGKGLTIGIADTAGGLFHVVTSPLPFDIPLPENGVDVKEITGGSLVTGPRQEFPPAATATERSEKTQADTVL